MIKYLGVIFFTLILQISQIQAQDKKLDTIKLEQEGPELTLVESTFDFGDITQGDQVKHTFAITNSGTTPLVLTNVLTTCGCTAPSYTTDPIMPNQKGEIEIAFDSRGKAGIQNKIITIISNAITPQQKIKITANVLPKN